jgi:hypothetical protein
MTAPPGQPRREDLISRHSAAALLKLHVNTIDRIARDAGLRKFRLIGDNQIYFLRTEFERVPLIEEVTS